MPVIEKVGVATLEIAGRTHRRNLFPAHQPLKTFSGEKFVEVRVNPFAVEKIFGAGGGHHQDCCQDFARLGSRIHEFAFAQRPFLETESRHKRGCALFPRLR